MWSNKIANLEKKKKIFEKNKKEKTKNQSECAQIWKGDKGNFML